MESEDVARKFLNDKMEATPQDHKGSVSFHNPSAFVNSTTLGGHPSFPTNTPGLQQGHMDNTAPRNPTVRMNRLAAGEVEERSTVSEPQNGPLNLLDLPVDILKDILSQVTYTSDLTALALTHSDLYRLAIPMIYSRFSIVWPSIEGSPDSDKVDALTYGLATLVMGEELFEKTQKTADQGYCQHCTCEHCQNIKLRTEKHPTKRIRRGNRYAQHVRTFCIGNGPKEYVKEYHIKLESGKMLGTLAALSLARMNNLETFKWDMPTGLVRDIWVSLSLASTHLETVWIRFHDNGDIGGQHGPSRVLSTLQSLLPVLGPVPQTSSVQPDIGQIEGGLAPLELSHRRVERPSFSILPPLKRLSVLDVDELAYMDEMSVLLKNSIDTLRELRISVAPHLMKPGGWAEPANIAKFFSGVDVTALLFSKIYDGSLKDDICKTPGQHTQLPNTRATSPANLSGISHPLDGRLLSAVVSQNKADAEGVTLLGQSQLNSIEESATGVIPSLKGNKSNTLRLEVLEFEKMILNATALQNSIDWSFITSLTLLQCANHEQLWKALRKAYYPRSPSCSSLPVSPVFRGDFSQASSDEAVEILSQSNLRSFLPYSRPDSVSTYRMNLKRLHTDTVSPALISFLKETLAPNSLEWMFLQDGRGYISTVKLEAIFQGPIRRHRTSLTKVMIDSAVEDSAIRRKWTFNTEMLAFVSSDKMPSLKELAMCIDYKDWHYLLRRLPQIPQLRSLYIPHIAHHDYSRHLKVLDLVSQVVDLVAIRPEIRLNYLGLEDKCYQFVERSRNASLRLTLFDPDTMDIDEASEFNESGSEDNDDDEAMTDDGPVANSVDSFTQENSDDGEDEAEGSDEELSEVDREEPTIVARQILFFDSMVSVFKARHGDIRQ